MISRWERFKRYLKRVLINYWSHFSLNRNDRSRTNLIENISDRKVPQQLIVSNAVPKRLIESINFGSKIKKTYRFKQTNRAKKKIIYFDTGMISLEILSLSIYDQQTKRNEYNFRFLFKRKFLSTIIIWNLSHSI